MEQELIHLTLPPPLTGNLEHVLWLQHLLFIPEFQLRHIERCIVAFSGL